MHHFNQALVAATALAFLTAGSALASNKTQTQVKNSSSDAVAMKTAKDSSVDIQSVLKNPADYVGQKITLNGKIERVLDQDTFLMSASKDSAQRILVMTASPSAKDTNGQSAGTTAPTLKDDQNVEITGQVEMLTTTAERDVLNEKKDRASFTQVTTTTPVVVAQPNDIHPKS